MKIGILGAGVSGLSIGKLLAQNYNVEIMERFGVPGGIARTAEIEGVAYHKTGGHCFNSKYPDVLDFVFDNVLEKNKWHSVQRNAVIKLKNNEISYPIEYAVKQIHEFDPELAISITKDFLSAEDDFKYLDLDDWFRKKFGNTLAETYFIPYNSKIWNRSPKQMSPAWVEGKLPIPDKKSFFKGLISNESDKMPHANFFYPDTNNQNTFIESLASGLNITYGYNIDNIRFNAANNKWIINGDKEFDLVISTLPLNVLPHLITDTGEDILEAANKLRYNKVTTMLWETTGTNRTWTYIPEEDNFFHRYIHIGNFFNPSKNYSITEVVGEKTYDEMVENGKKDPFLKKPLSFNVSDHAYVVFDENYETATSKIKNYLNDINLFTLGRFGEWEYYNMDVCIKSSIELSKKINDLYRGSL